MKYLFKKINIFLLLGLLANCTTVFDDLKVPIKSSEIIVAVILPLSGQHENIGNSLLKSIHLSYKNNHNENFIIKVYDSKSDPKIAKKQAVKAYSDNASIIVGSLTYNETKEILSYTDEKALPVFTFSNNISLVNDFNNVYILPPLVNLEIEAIIKYAKENNAKKFAILAPEGRYGEIIVNTAYTSLKNNELELVKVITYPTNTAILTPYLKDLVPKENLRKYYNTIAKLKEGEEILDRKGNAITRVPLPALDFDTLLIGDFGNRLIIVSSHLPSVDVNYRRLKILGLANWENTLVLNDNILRRSYIPSFKDISQTSFFKGFKGYYNNNPTLLETVAYDAITFISSLIYEDNEDNIVVDITYDKITNSTPIKGVLGDMSFRSDHISQRTMDIKQIQQKSTKIVQENIMPNEFASIKDYRNLLEYQIKD